MSKVANVYSTPDNTIGNLNGLFKEQYADKLTDLIPEGLKIINSIDFLSKDKQGGNFYNQPIMTGLEHGVTFAASDEDAFNLNAPIAGGIQNAQVRGNPMVLRSVLGYVAASRSLSGGPKAFMDATKYLVANMLRSASKKLEIEALYGQVGYGVVGTTPTTNVVAIAPAEWASGIWAGAEGMPIEIYDATGVTMRGSFTVSSVDMAARTITLSSSPVTSGVAATDVIYHKGAFGNEFAGIHKILSTQSGSLFGINTSTYSIFRGNIYPAAGALSFAKLVGSAILPTEKGLDTKLTFFVNPRGWADLMNEQAALRVYDNSYSASGGYANGSNKLKFMSLNGELEIVPSIYVKEGYAYGLALEDWMRIGSSDLTFKRPGQGDEFFRDLENAAGYEMRLYTDQAIFCMAPGRSIMISGIVNS